jgi:hypothetical protein
MRDWVDACRKQGEWRWIGMVCEACGGTGECGPCDGYGTWDFTEEVIDCGACGGDGVCAECGGTGEIAETDNEESESAGVGE